MTVKIRLNHRHYGVHEPVEETEIPGEFGDYATPKPDEVRDDEYTINETALLAALPGDFLPVSAKRILLTVTCPGGSTGQSGLSEFRNWAKYFDAYCLEIERPEEPGDQS